MPNLAIIDELKNKYEIKYIGSRGGMEKDIVSPIVPFFEITTCKLKRSFDFSNFLIPFKLLKGYCEAKKILKAEKPNLVFSKGGYVSVPVVWACKCLKIPVVSHESDYSIGLANKLTCRYSNAVCTSFEDTAKSIRNGVYTGSPIRKAILNGNRSKAKHGLKLNDKLPTLLVVGGSLGSKTINDIVAREAANICKKFNIVHIVGKNNEIETHIENYNILPYAQNIGDFYALADVVLTRGGSNVIFELLALKKPMLIVPLEKGSRGDQVLNAEIFEKEGIALSCRERNLENENELLLKKIDELLKNKTKIIEKMQTKSTNGNKKIIEQIEKYLS